MAVPELCVSNVAFLAKHGIQLAAIEPLGAKVSGLDLKASPPSHDVLMALEVAKTKSENSWSFCRFFGWLLYGFFCLFFVC